MDEGGKPISPQKYDITFHNVCFAYEKRPILKNINFDISRKNNNGDCSAFRFGKNYIMQSYRTFWDSDTGSVCIGGHDVKKYSLDSLMSNISIGFQKVYLLQIR